MSIFENLIKIDENGNLSYIGWVEWEHFMIPNKPEWFRKIIRNLMAFFRHCLNCTVLDGCYFQDKNKPQLPLHEYCDCKKKNISYKEVTKKASCECAIEKFTKYIFKDTHSNSEKQIFYNLGYTIRDVEFLKNEFCKQALTQYLLGNYKLKNLDRMGQRLAIPIKLKNIIFYSGRMLYPEGKIKNTTPFGGWVK